MTSLVESCPSANSVRPSVPSLSAIGVERILCAIGAYAAYDGFGGYWVFNPEGRAVGAFSTDVFDDLQHAKTIAWQTSVPPGTVCWILSTFAEGGAA